jgi:DNA-binding transcriptional LysR family regulator
MNINNVKLFIKVVELGSFIKASEYCDVPRPTISRNIKSLEESLGVRLLERTTRKLTLTEVGEQFYLKALHIIGEIEQAEKEIAEQNKQLAGKLTVFAPVMLADICSDEIATFKEKYPQLQISLKSIASDQNIGIDKRFDLLLHVGQPPDSSFIGAPLADVSIDFYASPTYLEKYGAPLTPSQISQHKTIFHELTPGERPIWEFDEQRIELSPSAIVDSPYLSHSFAKQGIGIARLPKFTAEQSVQKGELVSLFNGRYASRVPIYGLYHSRRFIPTKVTRLIEHIKSHLQNSIWQSENKVIS